MPIIDADTHVFEILQHSGEDNVVIGTDYSHTDTSSELEAIQILRGNPNVAPEVTRQIVDDNARALYGL